MTTSGPAWRRPVRPASFVVVPRVPRCALPDGIYHVYARGVAASAAPFPEDRDKTAMFELLPGLRTRGLIIHAVCVMSTHYHGIFEGRRSRLSAGMQWLNWSYARAYNTAHDLHGHVFSERFQTRLVEDEAGLERPHRLPAREPDPRRALQHDRGLALDVQPLPSRASPLLAEELGEARVVAE